MSAKKQFRNMKPGTVFWVGKEEKKFALAKLWQPLPSQIRCEECGSSNWNATNFGNNVHVCSIHKFEVTGYRIEAEEEAPAREPIDEWGGYKIEDLQKAFSRVADPDDWKAPIKAKVLPDEKNITVAAIVFYTATNPDVKKVLQTKTQPAHYEVSSIGYRAGPAGDH